MTCGRAAPGSFDRLALGPQVVHFLSDFVYTLRGQFIVLALTVDHFAVVEAVAQHIPYAGLDRIVAIKVIDQSVADDPGYLDALRREAQLEVSLNGKVIGLLGNTKDQADVILGTIGEVLCERYGAGGVVLRR